MHRITVNNMVLKTFFLFCHRPVVIVEMMFIVDGIWTYSSGNSSSSMFVAHCDTLKTVSAYLLLLEQSGGSGGFPYVTVTPESLITGSNIVKPTQNENTE